MSYQVECREFVLKEGAGLQRALVAGFGRDLGQEAMAEALAYGWAHWDRIRSVENPAGYLYRVGYRWAIRTRGRRRPPTMVDGPDRGEPMVEPGLARALESLSERQRTVLLLIEGYGWTYAEVADLTGLSRGAVETHAQRGMRKLRDALGVVGSND